jgi:class 3 adenylate cyclase
VAVSVLSLTVATIGGLFYGQQLIGDLDEDRLIGLRTNGANNITSHMRSIESTSRILATSPQVAATIEEFTAAHAELLADPSELRDDAVEGVIVGYRERYLEPFAAAGVGLDLRDILADDNPAATYLQYTYAVAPAEAATVFDPANLDDPDDSRWTALHSVVHPVYREVVRRRDLVDLVLVEPENGYVVYSVQKRPDLGTSLDLGPFSGSVVARAFDRVRDDPEAGTALGDLGLYPPAGLTPVGTVASPVMVGDELVGVIVLLYDSDALTSTLTADGQWDQNGFPPTGETYLIAADGTLRSEPRSFIESPTAHVAESIDAGTILEDERTLVAASGSTVLVQRAVDETVNAALDGDDRTEERLTVTGERALSTAGPVPVEGLEWFVVSEVGADITAAKLDDFAQLLVIGASLFVVTITFAAVAWSSSILRPIREMSERLGSRPRSTEAIDVPTQSPVEFQRLGASFTEMVQTLEQQRAAVTSARDERIGLLRRMLPPGVADRVASGDLEAIERVPNASVAVLVVVGLGALVGPGKLETSRALVDQLHSELDEIGKRHGLERIKVVGDAYYAACGHSRPYIDHAPRMLSFAADAQDSIRELGSRSSVDLDVVVGIHTGPVTVGLTLESRLVYDAWGPTVSYAHHLARLGRRGQVLVTESTKSLLPDSIETEAVPADGETVWLVTTTTVGGRT